MNKDKPIGKEIVLEIKEALQADVDKGVARIPSKIMNSLGLVSGDIIEIKGKSSVVIRVLRSLSHG